MAVPGMEMDLELHKRVNEQSLALLERHRLFKHRFLSAFEFHHLVKEAAFLNSSTSDSAPPYLIKSGIDVRKSILQRLVDQTHSTQSGTSTAHGPILDASSKASDVQTAFNTTSLPTNDESNGTELSPSDTTLFEFQLHKGVLSAMEALKDRFRSRKGALQRIDALRAQRDELALEISSLEAQSTLSQRRQSSLKATIDNLTTSKTLLSARQHELFRPVVLVAESWDQSVGPDVAFSRSSVLRSAMNAYNASAKWAPTTEEDSEAIKFLVRAGVLRTNPSNPLEVQLRL